MLRFCHYERLSRVSLLPDSDPGTGLDLIGDLLHFGKEGRTGGGVDTELPGGKGEDGVVHLRELLYFRLDLGGAVGAVDIFQVVDHIRGLGISGSDFDHCAGLDLISDLLHFGKESRAGGGVDPSCLVAKVRTASSTSGSSFIFASILAEQLAQSIFSRL